MVRWKRGGRVLVCVIASAMLAAACQSSKAAETSTTPPTREVAARPGPGRTSTTTTTTAPVRTVTATGANGATFSVRPAALTVGRTVTVSGTGCPRADVVLVGISLGSGTGIEITAPRADATWSASAPVADGTALGAVQAVARCALRSNHQTVFVYPSLPVHVATFRSVRVTPATTVRAGTTLTVASRGPCPAPAIDDPIVTLSPEKPDVDPIEQNRGETRSPGGNWAVTITVPAGSATGTRTLSSVCQYSRGYMAFYPDVTITVAP